MQDKAELVGHSVKAIAAFGGGITTLAWWNTNSSAITAFCAFATFIVVMITAIINWHYKYNHKPKTEAIMTEKEKPVKEDKKPVKDEPVSTESVPCTPSNPCDDN